MSWLGSGAGSILMPPPGKSLDYSQLNDATTAALAGMRNRFINGACRVAQRGTNVAHTANSVSIGAADRWYVYSAGTAATSYTDIGTPSGDGALRVSVTAAGNTALAVGQKIEAANVQDCYNAPIVVTAWLYTDVASPTFTCNAYVWANKDDPSSGTWCNGVVEKLIVAGNWTFIRSKITLNTKGPNGFGIEFGFPAAPPNTNIGLGGAQLEVGSINTPFEHRPVGLDVLLCHRYYWVAIPNLILDGPGGGQTIYADYVFPTTMRVVPTNVITGVPTYDNTAPGPIQVNNTFIDHIRFSMPSKAGVAYSYCYGFGFNVNAEFA